MRSDEDCNERGNPANRERNPRWPAEKGAHTPSVATVAPVGNAAAHQENR
jgi:hypothetical protein